MNSYISPNMNNGIEAESTEVKQEVEDIADAHE